MHYKGRIHQPEFLLARLQKPQRSANLLASNRNNQVSRVSATLRNKKSRKTLMRLEVLSSSG